MTAADPVVKAVQVMADGHADGAHGARLAILDNVTTIMLVAPVTVVVCNRLRIPAQLYGDGLGLRLAALLHLSCS
ncbi:hypothetical protein Aph01nite_17510 [Acrocarpospora phusangensis]|uniref:Uncharacterized protein n=1 Tax=Acrocarpospora phusangensis TaxID=1070424 RepID=A0A919Q768_9ACTN|nr:hypothetical protein [Acrocarpospora phusangensis]GIH23441.1 hypothetical protein Aph01nite_17510 [Acrocarpospora phusangensis]